MVIQKKLIEKLSPDGAKIIKTFLNTKFDSDKDAIRWLTDSLVKKYRYKKLPYELSKIVKDIYIYMTPKYFRGEPIIKAMCPNDGNKIILATYDRLVVGDYGPYLEIFEKQLYLNNIDIKEDEKFRLEKKYQNNIKYIAYTDKETKSIKIYYQLKKVSYADYKPGYYYISPFDIKI